MSSKPIAEGVKIQGILANGYGIMPQSVTRNENLTIEAKAIYAYLTAFSGSSFKPIFPSRDLMLKELNMSINRFYKHMQLLLDANLVTIERTVEGNIFGKNIYSLVLVPEIETGKESVRVKRPAKILRRLDRKNQKSEKPIVQEEKKKEIEIPDRIAEAAHPDPDMHSTEPATVGDQLSAQLGIDNLIKNRPESKDLIESILMVVKDMAMSEQITINGSVKKKDAIKQMINNLRMEHIEAMVNNISQSGQTIRRKKAYIQSCIGNSLFDITGPLDYSKKKPVKRENENSEESEAAKLKKMFEQIPELKDLDEQIFALGSKISKAILSGNEIQTKALLAEKTRLDDKRKKIIFKCNPASST
ncbi:MAG: hypothetical protein PHE79_11695 [Eubacteriales bacterium]|nr:hypothetical protein [Eubacteriales bacterium]